MYTNKHREAHKDDKSKVLEMDNSILKNNHTVTRSVDDEDHYTLLLYTSETESHTNTAI